MNSHDAGESFVCHRCGALLTPGEGSFYLVRIEAYADPTGPKADDDRTAGEAALEIECAIEQMREMSQQELMDQVYRRMVLYLCRPCYTTWIEDPVGGSDVG